MQLEKKGSKPKMLMCLPAAFWGVLGTSNMDKTWGWMEQLRASYCTLLQFEDFRLQSRETGLPTPANVFCFLHTVNFNPFSFQQHLGQRPSLKVKIPDVHYDSFFPTSLKHSEITSSFQHSTPSWDFSRWYLLISLAFLKDVLFWRFIPWTPGEGIPRKYLCHFSKLCLLQSGQLFYESSKIILSMKPKYYLLSTYNCFLQDTFQNRFLQEK